MGLGGAVNLSCHLSVCLSTYLSIDLYINLYRYIYIYIQCFYVHLSLSGLSVCVCFFVELSSFQQHHANHAAVKVPCQEVTSTKKWFPCQHMLGQVGEEQG